MRVLTKSSTTATTTAATISSSSRATGKEVLAPGASSPVSISQPWRGKRRPNGPWSWLVATTSSAAIVASGAYMHTAIHDSLVSAPPLVVGEQDLLLPPPPDGTSTSAGLMLTVYVVLVAWLLALILLRQLHLHLPLRRLVTRVTSAIQDHRYWHVYQERRRARRTSGSGGGRRDAKKKLLQLSEHDAIEIDDEDILVVTSLSSLGRAYPTAPLSASAVESSSPDRDAADADSDDAKEPLRATPAAVATGRQAMAQLDAHILLHPRAGARGGRHPRNQIVVDDPYVSRSHFEIQYDPLEKEYYLRDLGSTTGTFVFLTPEKPKRLHVEDRVKLGDTEFEVVAIDANVSTGTPFLRICFTEGPLCGIGQTIGKTAVTLGRRSSNALCITDDTSISGRHSVITYLDDAFYITDLHSTNGTAVRLSASGTASGRRYLLHNDVFGVGSNRFRVEYAHELFLQERQQQRRQQQQQDQRQREHPRRLASPAS